MVLTVSTLLADNKEESADDITAAATDANPELFLKVFILMVLIRMNQSENELEVPVWNHVSYESYNITLTNVSNSGWA